MALGHFAGCPLFEILSGTWYWVTLAPYLWLATVMPTGLVTPSPGDPSLVTLFFWANTYVLEDKETAYCFPLFCWSWILLWLLCVASSNGSNNPYMIFMFLRPILSHIIRIVKQQYILRTSCFLWAHQTYCVMTQDNNEIMESFQGPITISRTRKIEEEM